jgi:hypothetical protein
VSGMQLGEWKIIYEKSIPLFMKSGMSFKSRDEISIRGGL